MSLKSITYTCANLFPDADFTPDVMVPVYVVHLNFWSNNIDCLIQNLFVRGLVVF